MTKVSIITPCYNAATFLHETYEPLKAQTFSNWEWIVVDDCSKDDSLNLLRELEKTDARVKVFQNQENSGAAFTRNACLEKASGDYYAFLDSDDLWEPSKLEAQVDLMEEENVDFSFHDYETVNANRETLKTLHLKESYTHKDILKFNPFATSSIMIRAKLIKDHNIKFKNHLRRRQDYFFWYDSLEAASKVKGISKVLSFYRLDNMNSLSANKFQMAKIQWQLYRDEFKIGFFKRVYYTLHYAVHGVLKYLV